MGETTKEITKEKRINAEIKRLAAIYKELPENIRKLCDGLIVRAAYMRVTLEDYEKDMDENGYIEKFKQSDKLDAYERGRPVVGFYNTMAKNYQTIIKQLAEKLPAEKAESTVEEIREFLSGSKK